MRPGRTILLVVALAGGGWLAWQWWFPGDEAQIRAVLDRIADGVGSEAGDTRLARVARATALQDELDETIVVELGPPFERLDGRQRVMGAVARVTAAMEGLEVELADVDVVVGANRQEAAVTLTAEAQFEQAGGSRGFEARELHLTFRRAEGRWVVDGVTLVRTLEPVGER